MNIFRLRGLQEAAVTESLFVNLGAIGNANYPPCSPISAVPRPTTEFGHVHDADRQRVSPIFLITPAIRIPQLANFSIDALRGSDDLKTGNPK